MENIVWDFLVLAIAGVFFALSAAMVTAFERLQKESIR
jgi:hypothetical protein